MAEPFSLDRMPTHIHVPLPAHVASQMQAVAEQRARDVEAGAATAWGTAQIDLLISQLRAAGVLPEGIVPEGVQTKHSGSGSVGDAVASTGKPSVSSQELPPLLPGMSEDTLRLMVVRYYSKLPEAVLRESALAFRKDAHRVMRDVLMMLGSAHSVYLSKPVDWVRLKSTSEALVVEHGAKLTNIFVDAIKASSLSIQEDSTPAKD